MSAEHLIYWVLSTWYWLLNIVHWMLSTECWGLITEQWVLSTAQSALSREDWILSTMHKAYRVLSIDWSWVLHTEHCILKTEHWVLRTGHWVLHIAHQVLSPEYIDHAQSLHHCKLLRRSSSSWSSLLAVCGCSLLLVIARCCSLLFVVGT